MKTILGCLAVIVVVYLWLIARYAFERQKLKKKFDEEWEQIGKMK